MTRVYLVGGPRAGEYLDVDLDAAGSHVDVATYTGPPLASLTADQVDGMIDDPVPFRITRYAPRNRADATDHEWYVVAERQAAP